MRRWGKAAELIRKEEGGELGGRLFRAEGTFSCKTEKEGDTSKKNKQKPRKRGQIAGNWGCQ